MQTLHPTNCIWEILIHVLHVCATCNIDDGKVRYQSCSDDYIAEHAYVYTVQIKHTIKKHNYTWVDIVARKRLYTNSLHMQVSKFELSPFFDSVKINTSVHTVRI